MEPPQPGEGKDTHRASSLVPGFTSTSYGAGFADVYDRWYGDVSPVDATVALLTDLAGQEPILELGIGTGRLAIPLAARAAPVEVWGIDTSPQMLDVCTANDIEQRVVTVLGDMARDLPAGPFSLVFVAYNTLFNLDDEAAQARCFSLVAERLIPGGRFVVEAFVPDDPPTTPDAAQPEQQLSIRSMTASEVVLAVTRNDHATQRAGGQFIELRDGEPVRLRPWAIRYSTVEQLDAMASAAGLVLERRFGDIDRSPFTDESTRHVSVYQRPR